jgi:hypothetical protein
MTDYAAVLTAIRPGAQWTLDGDDYSGLTWLDESPKPTKKTLDDAWPQVEYELAYEAVESARRARYQSETDGIYFAAMRETTPDLTAWIAAVDQVKADLPYPEPLA